MNAVQIGFVVCIEVLTDMCVSRTARWIVVFRVTLVLGLSVGIRERESERASEGERQRGRIKSMALRW